MARSQLISAVKFVTLLLVAIPISVDSVLYRLVFDPSKFMIDCKDTKNSIYDVFDFTKLNISLSDDNKMKLIGSIAVNDDRDPSVPLAVGNEQLYHNFLRITNQNYCGPQNAYESCRYISQRNKKSEGDGLKHRSRVW